jgi:hypothetical protein
MTFEEVEAINIGKFSDNELSNAICSYKDRIKLLNDKIDNAKETYAKLEQELLRRYEKEAQTSTTFVDANGRKRTLFLSTRLNPIARFSYADEDAGKEFFHMLRQNHLGHLMDRTPGEAMKGARSVFKEIAERDGRLPEDMDKFVDIQIVNSIGLRSK